MSPAFETGSLVIVEPVEPEDIAVRDIITFRDRPGGHHLTTHRVVAVHKGKELGFTTRGDANKADDTQSVPAGNVVGRVTRFVPYAGYLLHYVKTREGLLIFIVLPGVIIIVSELIFLFRYAASLDKKKKKAGGKIAG